MTALVLRMLWARRAEALTLALLAVFAVATAAAAPAAQAAVDNMIVTEAVATAPASERSVSLYSAGSGREFEQFAPAALRPTGLQLVYMTQMTVLVRDRAPATLLRLQHRDDVCAHLTIVAGRCAMGSFDVVLGEETARRLGLRPGSLLPTDEVIRPEQGGITMPAGNPRELVVVGVYRVAEPAADYWTEPLALRPSDVVEEPVYATGLTVSYSNPRIQQQALVGFLPAGRLRAETLDDVESAVEQIRTSIATSASGAVVRLDSGVPGLIARIRANIAKAHEIAPLALAPLIALILYVIYLATSSSADKQRAEIALLGLRGVTRGQRWWLAAGQATIVLLIGLPVGLGVVQPIHALIDPPPGRQTAVAVIVVLAGVALVATLAHGSVTRRPIPVLLRRALPAGGRTPRATIEILVTLLALLAIVQLRTGNSLAGLAALVPGLVAVSLALIVARLVRPTATMLARFALGRGRPGVSLAAAHLARRPGSHHLVVVVSIAVALLGFCVAGLDVAQRARHDRAVIDTGTDRVVRLQPVDPRLLLATVRGVDPAGDYAMAVVPTPSSAPTLAVDATRLASAAAWRSEFGADPAELQRLLHPPAPASFVLRAGEVTAEVEDDGSVGADPRSLVVSFEPLTGGPGIDASSGLLRPGRHTYRLAAPGCAEGCRLSGLRFVFPGDPTRPFTSTLRGLRATGADVPFDLTDRKRWLGLNGTTIDAGPEGLVVTGTPSARDSIQLAVLDAPYPLPVAVTASRSGPGDRVGGFDRELWDATTVARPRLVPRLGGNAVLVDLEYLDRITPATFVLPGAEVWLGVRAPADAVERLRSAGLPVIDSYTADQAERQLSVEGPALARWLGLAAAAVGILLGLVATFLVIATDGPRLAQDLGHLSRQGLSRREVRRAVGGGVVAVVLTGCLVGLGVSWLVWALAGDSVPLFADNRPAPTAPAWPRAGVVGLTWLAATALLLAFAASLAGRTLRLIPHPRER